MIVVPVQAEVIGEAHPAAGWYSVLTQHRDREQGVVAAAPLEPPFQRSRDTERVRVPALMVVAMTAPAATPAPTSPAVIAILRARDGLFSSGGGGWGR